MKKGFFTFALFLMTISAIYSQSVIGKWKTIDDETGVAKSIVEVYEKSGKIYGKVMDILREGHKNDVCVGCTGANKNRPILGMVIIKDLEKDGSEYNSGTILDPTSGKEYKCYITLETADKLKVRGYVGFSLMGRTQYWQRVKN
ncbi:DUF2147 domain-containing protein [Flavobacterium agrisoli]|uniref:DUF2147 domain-containing protein n=1 Tax=Flavobacterium agrisoli TaxID=2793066 RepID=A0A934PKM3_9FLAO|nr:DUF2147 domain-containing protein [Flavobacterium agrisoli]MBK0369025.1 DUF2147 domain-containing protein [Flavobacterium agrisoli]